MHEPRNLQKTSDTADAALRSVRVVHCALLISMILFASIAEIQAPHELQNLDKLFPLALGMCSLAIIGLALFFRTKKLQPAVETLQSKPDDAMALRQWRTGSILTATLLEAVVLYGFVLRYLGAPMKVSLTFYVVGIALMVLWWPQRP
jgi:uncharacterized membrane protein